MGKSSGSGESKFAFYVIAAIAILFLVDAILTIVGVGGGIIGWLGRLATLVAVGFVAFCGYRFVARKAAVWKVLYFVLLAVILVGIILPHVGIF
jgi:hypothetical protein